jgi:hypothetical protein
MVAPDLNATAVADYFGMTLDQVFTHVTLAVVGKVTNIAPTRYNTPDGRFTDAPNAAVFRMRAVTLEVASVVWSAPPVDEGQIPKVGDDLDVWFLGDGTETGIDIGGLPLVSRGNQLDGPVSVGDTKLLLLAEGLVYAGGTYPEDVIPGLAVATCYYSNFDVTGDDEATNALDPSLRLAISGLPGRIESVQAAAQQAFAEAEGGENVTPGMPPPR